VTAKSRGALLLCALAGCLAGLAWVVTTQWLPRPDDATGRPPVGEAAPGFDLPRLEGGRMSLDDLRGKVVYLNLWATWCAPCRTEAPSLQRLYADLRDDGFVVVAPSVDAAGDEAKIEAFRTELELEFPILLDPDKLVATRYGVSKFPETYLIDAEGKLVEAYIGPRDWDDPKYARAIRRLLAARVPGGGDSPG
jgi:peroxiredoxin